MKSQPEPVSAGALLDLDEIARQLHADAAATPVRHAARTILRERDLRVVVIAMEAGATLAEHQAADTVFVQLLHGRVHVRLGDRIVDMQPKQLLPIEGGVAHDVTALEPSAFVLTLAHTAA